MWSKRNKRVTAFFLTLIMFCGMLQVGHVEGSIGGLRAPQTVQDVISSLSDSQLRAYDVLNMSPRSKGLVGFDDNNLDSFNPNENIKVIVEFVHQPPVVAQVESAMQSGTFISIDTASILAESDHVNFKNSLDSLFNMPNNRRNGSSPVGYEIMSEYRTALNGVAMSLPVGMLEEVAKFDSVQAIYPNELINYSPVEYAPTSASDVLGMTEERSYLNIEALHNAGITGKGVTVCVIDTGIDYNHPDFNGAFSSQSPSGDSNDLMDGKFYGRNFVKYEESEHTQNLGLTDRAANDPMEITYDEYLIAKENNNSLTSWESFITAHGTHVSGTIASRGINFTQSGASSKGIAPEATLYVYRVLSYGGGLTSWIVEAIEMVAEDKPDVVNMSLGSTSQALSGLSSQAVSRIMLSNPEITFVLAAGNDGALGSYSVGSPSSSPLAITVGNGTVAYKDIALTAKVGASSNLYKMDGFYGSAGTQFTLNSFGTYTSNYVDLSNHVNGEYGLVILPKDGQEITAEATSDNIGTGTAEQFAAYCAENGSTALEGKFVAVQRSALFLDTIRIAKQYKVGALILINDSTSNYDDIKWYRGSMYSVPMFLMRNADGLNFVNAALDNGGMFKIADKDDAAEELNGSSSRGPVRDNNDIKPDVVAPGTLIYSTVPYYDNAGADGLPQYTQSDDGAYGSAYKYMTGTSMASPHVAGIAALMYQYSNKTWDAQEIKARLMNTANAMSPNEADSGYSVHDVGAGYVNPQRAVYASSMVTAKNEMFVQDEYQLLENGEIDYLSKTPKYADIEAGMFNFGQYLIPEDINEAVDFNKTITATIHNSSSAPKTFLVDYEFNTLGTLIDSNVKNSGAALVFSSNTVTVPAGGTASFDVTMSIPKTVVERDSFEGYVMLTNASDSFETYSMPFAAFVKVDSIILQDAFLNQPVIAAKGSEQIEGVSGSASLYYSFSEIPTYLYYGIIEGEATQEEWENQLQWMGEFGYTAFGENSELSPGVIYFNSGVIRNTYSKYNIVQGNVLIGDENKRIEPGHYKLVLVVINQFHEEYHALDFYVDGDAPQLEISGIAEDTGSDISMVAIDENANITGTLLNTNTTEYKNAGIRYEIWDEGDELPNEPDQSYNAIFAKAGDEYIRGEINAQTGEFEIDLSEVIGTNKYLDITLYAIKNFSISQFDIETDQQIYVMDVFDPEKASFGESDGLGGIYAWYGTNMLTKDVIMVTDEFNIVLDKTSIRLSAGGEQQLRAFLTPSAQDAGYTIESYESSDTNIVSVENDGMLTAHKPGSATITVTASDGTNDITATCEVIVSVDVSAGVKLEPGSYVYFGNYKHVTEAQLQEKLTNAIDGTYVRDVITSGTHWKITEREDEKTPVLWEIMGEEVVGDSGQTDGLITLLSKYVLDLYDYLPTVGNYYQTSWRIAPHYNSNLQVFLNGGNYTVYPYDELGRPLDSAGGSISTDMLFLNGLDDEQEMQDRGTYFKNSFTNAEYNIIPFYDVWVGRYNNNILNESNPDTGYDFGTLKNQKFYIPISTYASESDTGANAVLSWAAGNGSKMYSDNVLSEKTATLKGNSSGIAYRDRAVASPVGLASIRQNGVTIMSDGTTKDANGITAKTGVRPATKIMPEFIVYAKEITETGNNFTFKADGKNYVLPNGSSKYYKLTVHGGNNGSDVGTLTNIPQSYEAAKEVLSSQKLTIENVAAIAAQSGANYSNYTIAYKIVDGDGNIVKYGEFEATEAEQNIELDVMSLDGEYSAYIWLQENGGLISDTAGVVYVFDINVTLAADDTTLLSSIGTVTETDGGKTITVPFTTTVKMFEDSITVADGASFVISNGGVDVLDDDMLENGWIVTVTAADGITVADYTIVLEAASSDANIIETSIGEVSASAITKIPAETTAQALINALTLPEGASAVIYKGNSTDFDIAANSDIVQSGWIIAVTAQDGTTVKTYELTTASDNTTLVIDSDVLNTLIMAGFMNKAEIKDFNDFERPNKILVSSALYDMSMLTVGTLIRFITPPAGAQLDFYFVGEDEPIDTNEINIESTPLNSVDKVVVTAADGITKAVYLIGKYSDDTILTANEGAAAEFEVVITVVHPEGGNEGKIIGLPENMIPLNSFNLFFTVADGASFEILDANDNVLPMDFTPISNGYQVVITAEDGETKATYIFSAPSALSDDTTPTEHDNADVLGKVTITQPSGTNSTGIIRIVVSEFGFFVLAGLGISSYDDIAGGLLEEYFINMPSKATFNAIDVDDFMNHQLHEMVIEITAENGYTKAKYQIILGDDKEPEQDDSLSITITDPRYVLEAEADTIYVPHFTGTFNLKSGISVDEGIAAEVYKTYNPETGEYSDNFNGALIEDTYYLIVKADTGEGGSGGGFIPLSAIVNESVKVYTIIVLKDKEAHLENKSTDSQISIKHIGAAEVDASLTGFVTNVPQNTTIADFKAMITAKPTTNNMLPVRIYPASSQTEKADTAFIEDGDRIVVGSQLINTSTYVSMYNRTYAVFLAVDGEIYLISSLWTIDNNAKTISGVPFDTPVDIFISNLSGSADNVTFEVYETYEDEENNIIATGMVANGYKVILTDGILSAEYTINVDLPSNENELISSSKGLISHVNKTITNVPYGTDIDIFKVGITVSQLATFEVYESDGTTPATVLADGCKLIIKAQSGVPNTYTISLAPGGDASLTSSLWTVTNIGVSEGTITNVTYNVPLSIFIAALTPSVGALIEVFDGSNPITNPNGAVQTGYTVVVTSGSGTRTYTVTTLQGITVAVNITESGLTEGAGTYSPGAVVRLTAAPDAGYRFVGWYDNGTGTLLSSDVVYTFTAVEGYDRSIEARFVKLYNVALEVFPADYAATLTGDGIYDNGTEVTVTASAPFAGSEFAGWYINNTLVSSDTSFSFTISSDTTLEARYATVYISVGLKDPLNGGTVSGEGYYCIGEQVVIGAEPGSGYLFSAWYENYSDTSTAYPQTYTFTASDNQSFLAEFVLSPDAVYVTVISETGGTVTGGGYYMPDTNFTLVAAPDAGYEFAGWYEDSMLLSTEASETFAADNRTLTAKWVKVHTVTFAVNGGSSVEPQSVKNDELATTPANPSRVGYAFNGWYTSQNLTVLYNFNDAVTGDIVLYAGWVKLNYNVNFNSNGGREIASQVIVHGGYATNPAVTRIGYVFGGWYTDYELTVPYNFNQPVISNVYLYAKWNALQLSVSFETNGLYYIPAQSVAYGEYISTVYPSVQGYVFRGWYVNRDMTISYSFDTPLYDNITLYGRFTPVIVNPAPAPTPVPTPAATSTPKPAETTAPTPTPIPTPAATSDPAPSEADEFIVLPILPKNAIEGNVLKEEGDSLLASAIVNSEDMEKTDVNVNIGANATIEFSVDSLNNIVEAEKDLSVTNFAATVIIQSELLGQFVNSIDEGNSDDVNQEAALQLFISPSSEATIPVALINNNSINKKLIMSAVDVKVYLNSVEVKEYDAPLKMMFDLSDMKLTSKQISKLTVVRLHDDGSYDQIGGQWEDGNFTAYTSKLGKYAVIVSDTLVAVKISENSNDYTVNGVGLISDVAPAIFNDRIMVPIRVIAESLGAKVDWNDSTKTVTITLNDKVISLTIDQLDEGMDVAPFIHQGRTFVPLRYISENLGANVIWDETDRKVTIYR